MKERNPIILHTISGPSLSPFPLLPFIPASHYSLGWDEEGEGKGIAIGKHWPAAIVCLRRDWLAAGKCFPLATAYLPSLAFCWPGFHSSQHSKRIENEEAVDMLLSYVFIWPERKETEQWIGYQMLRLVLRFMLWLFSSSPAIPVLPLPPHTLPFNCIGFPVEKEEIQ